MSKKNAIPIRKPAIHIALVESDPHFAEVPDTASKTSFPKRELILSCSAVLKVMILLRLLAKTGTLTSLEKARSRGWF